MARNGSFGSSTACRGEGGDGRALGCYDILSGRAVCGIDNLPSSAKGSIEIDEARRDLRVAVGQIIFALQQLSLGGEHIQKVDRPLRVTLPRGLQGGLIFSDGAGDVGASALRFAIGRQRIVDVLPGPQNRFLKQDSCLALLRFPQRQCAPQIGIEIAGPTANVVDAGENRLPRRKLSTPAAPFNVTSG